MLFSDIAVYDADAGFRPHTWVGTDGARIVYLDDAAPADPSVYGESYDGRGRLLMPGMYNAHAHAPMTLLRGWGEGLPLQSWLTERIFPFEARLVSDDVYFATLLSCAEMLRFGTVSFTDMYYESDARVKAVVEAGMKMNLGEAIDAEEDVPYSENRKYDLVNRLLNDYQGIEDGRIVVDFSLHAEYTSTPKTVIGLADAAREAGVRMQVHLSETRDEVEGCRQRHGVTPPRYFADAGLFDVPCNAAHCVWLDDDDFAILRDHDVTVSTNPVSNCKLGSGFAPVKRLLDEGIPVALGTDGCASNNNLDMFQDMYLLALVHKATSNDPTVLSARQVLNMATRTGALSQGRDDCGAVRVGMRADLCVLDTTGPSWCPDPDRDAAAAIVYAGHGSDVCLTMVDGRVLYRDGVWPTLDIERVRWECSQRTDRIAATFDDAR